MYHKHMWALLIIILFSCGQASRKELPTASITHHDIVVFINPEKHTIKGVDKLTVALPAGRNEVGFLLHSMIPKVELIDTSGFVLSKQTIDTFTKHYGESLSAKEKDLYNYYVVKIDQPDSVVQFAIAFEGTIYDSLQKDEADYARGFAQTSGLINEKGVFLFGDTGWIPLQKKGTFTFKLKTHLPLGWQSISQGVETMRGYDGEYQINEWTCNAPMEEAYLIAGKYVITEEDHRGIKVMTYTYADEPELTKKYREATKRYLDMYSGLIGPYPYKKFALVENFWQTGYGMPSFTLLGSQVIRLPFIIYTSYGHEILHNWWGNGVYVDWESGNWCEGLTNYMADHYYKELAGQDAAYRRSMLQNYLNYVQKERDFPLTQFNERHDPATQAVGYSKSAMVFHMLDKMLGRDKFLASVRSLYKNYRFKAASWSDLEKVFSEQYESDLSWFFDQWVNRAGAPVLKLEKVVVVPNQEKFDVQVTLSQSSPTYQLLIPIKFTGANDTTIDVVMKKKKETFTATLSRKPKKVWVDPTYDVFRRLDRAEIPPSLSQTLGANQAIVVLPSSSDKAVYQAYQNLSEKLSTADDVVIQSDDKTKASEMRGKAVWVMGMTNTWFDEFLTTLPPEVQFSNGEWHLYGETFPSQGHSVVLTTRHADDPEFSWTFIHIDNLSDLPSITRKLPHYGKYGYLIFEGTKNVLKGEWKVQSSPLIKDVN